MNSIKKYAELKSLLEEVHFEGIILIKKNNEGFFRIYPKQEESVTDKLESCVDPIFDYLIEREEERVHQEFRDKINSKNSSFLGALESSNIENIEARMSISGDRKKISTNIRFDYEFSLETNQVLSKSYQDKKLINLLKESQFIILENHITNDHNWTAGQENKSDLDIFFNEMFNYSKKRISKQRVLIEEVATSFITDDINVSIPIRPRFYLVNVLDPGNYSSPYLAHYNEWILTFSFENLM